MRRRFPALVSFLALAVLVLGAAPLYAASQVFELDAPHSVIGFSASTLLFDVPGRFDRFKVEISGDPDSGAEAKIRVEIDARSINTANKMRDKHLVSEDFLDVAKHPKIVFTSSKVSREGARVLVEGTLELHGVKKEMKLGFEASTGKNGAGFTEHTYRGSIPLNRKDFGIGADSVAAKISLKDQVVLNLMLAGFFEAPKAKK